MAKNKALVIGNQTGTLITCVTLGKSINSLSPQCNDLHNEDIVVSIYWSYL